ncbi:MAG: hypothetical protein Q7J69_02605 [Candidatus Omnitrophota bacterium]|nr:hypothetical protein [Candidatus Omnitrophota bacterium]
MVTLETSRKTGSILIVAAVPQELQDFRPQRNSKVQCLVTGMGPRAGEVVRRRLAEGDIELVVSTGFAGGVRPGFRVGDLVLASEVIHAPSGLRRRPVSSFFSLSESAFVGPFVTVEKALADPKEKAWAGNRFGAIAVDMESAAVAQAATQAGVAWVAVRAILDPMETPLVIHSRAQALRCLAVPRRWKEFSGFLQMVRTASRSLAGGLNDLIERRKRWI